PTTFTCGVRVMSHLPMFVFFFQAEDGIRDFHVTGVQTCALPIYLRGLRPTEVGGRTQHSELEQHLTTVLRTGRGHDMQTYMKATGASRAQAWLARLAPLTDDSGRVRGVCVTAHDFTEQYRARERLLLVNEASIRIGTTLDVARTAQELAEVCVPALADFVSVDLLEPLEPGGDPGGPLTAPVSLRRVAHHSRTPGSPE